MENTLVECKADLTFVARNLRLKQLDSKYKYVKIKQYVTSSDGTVKSRVYEQ